MTDAQTLLQEGLSAFRARAYDQALQAWRALLDVQPDNQQVQQLVERTEALAAEGHLVHTLKEELADLREELATTRQARNDLLMEMASVHKRYQAREKRLWRLQEEREWELREALAHAELSRIVGDDAQTDSGETDEAAAQSNDHTPRALQDAHEEIQKLLQALNAAELRIATLESTTAESQTSQKTDDETALDNEPTDARPSHTSNSLPRVHDDHDDTSKDVVDDAVDDAAEKTAASASERTHDTSTRPSRTLPAEDNDETHDPRSAADDASPERTPPTQRPTRTHTPPPFQPKHTQTSHTITVGQSLFEPDESTDYDDEEAGGLFDGPLIDDAWLKSPTVGDSQSSIADELVSLVSQSKIPALSTAADTEEDTHGDDAREDADNLSAPKAADIVSTEAPNTVDDAAVHDASTADTAADDSASTDATSLDSARSDADDSTSDEDAFDTAPHHIEPSGSVDRPDNAPSTDGRPTPDAKPAPSPTSSSDAVPSSLRHDRSAIPDTAKIDTEPMDDKNISDGFSDELTSALGSTPAPPRLFTGVQPELPDVDIFDEEPEQMSPDDLEKFPTSIPVRYKSGDTMEDPIARYLLTHVDGVSTFMELRGTVGLPPAAVDRGFRILLAHDIIRVEHQ